MKKTVKCTVLCLIMVCCMVFSLPLTASAAVREHSFNFVEPSTGEGQGYILVEYLTSSGNYRVRCFFWNSVILGSSNIDMNTDTSMFIDISGKTISFIPYYSSDYGFIANFSFFDSTDNSIIRYYYRESDSPLETLYSFTFGSSYTIVSYKVFGDVVRVTSDFSSDDNRDVFNVVWGETKLLLEDISVLITKLNTLIDNDSTKIQLLRDILSDTSNIDATLLRLETLLEQLVNAKGESTFEEPSTESISDYNKAEDELVSGADDTSDIEQQIEDFEIDDSSSSLIWGIIQGYLNQNELVFGLVVGVLCLGIIALILNR